MIVMSRGGQWPNVGHMESQLSTQQLHLTILGLRNIHNLLQHQKKYNKLF